MSPTRHAVTPSPSATTRPATSSPRIGEASAGGGYAPARCRQSGRLTPAKATSISTSPGFGTGTAPVPTTMTSGGPGCSNVAWRIVAGIVMAVAGGAGRATIVADGASDRPQRPASEPSRSASAAATSADAAANRNAAGEPACSISAPLAAMPAPTPVTIAVADQVNASVA